jgi:hypothetical protein
VGIEAAGDLEIGSLEGFSSAYICELNDFSSLIVLLIIPKSKKKKQLAGDLEIGSLEGFSSAYICELKDFSSLIVLLIISKSQNVNWDKNFFVFNHTTNYFKKSKKCNRK